MRTKGKSKLHDAIIAVLESNDNVAMTVKEIAKKINEMNTSEDGENENEEVRPNQVLARINRKEHLGFYVKNKAAEPMKISLAVEE